MGMLGKLWEEEAISLEIKRKCCMREVLLPVLCGSKTGALSVQERRKREEFEIYNIRRGDRVRSTLIRKRCGWEFSILERVELK